MIKIYIDKNLREVTFKDRKEKMIKQYTNLSTKNSEGVLITIKLIIYSLNKIFNMNTKYDDEEYVFYINDEELFKYIKDTDQNTFYEKVNKDWRTSLEGKTYCELGRLLAIFKKLHNKDIVTWERDELFNLRNEKEKLYACQSECDIETQDILHAIQQLRDDEVTEQICISFIIKLRNVRKRRNKIKTGIKGLERRERSLIHEK